MLFKENFVNKSIVDSTCNITPHGFMFTDVVPSDIVLQPVYCSSLFLLYDTTLRFWRWVSTFHRGTDDVH